MTNYREVREQFPDGGSRVLYVITLWRQNVLVLTPQEYHRGLRRGRWWRRKQTHEARMIREEARHER